MSLEPPKKRRKVENDQRGKLAEEIIKIVMGEGFFKHGKTDYMRSREEHPNSMSVRAVSKYLHDHAGLVWCDGSNALTSVAARGTPRRLKYLLSLPHYVSPENLTNDTPLLEAITRSFRNPGSFIVKDLIDRGWKVSSESIWRAAGGRNQRQVRDEENASHDTSILSYLLDHGGNVNGNRIFPAIKNAIIMHNVEGVRILLEHGADPNFEFDDSERPLHQAAISLHACKFFELHACIQSDIKQIVRLLVQAGADRTIPSSSNNLRPDEVNYGGADLSEILDEVEAELGQTTSP